MRPSLWEMSDRHVSKGELQGWLAEPQRAEGCPDAPTSGRGGHGHALEPTMFKILRGLDRDRPPTRRVGNLVHWGAILKPLATKKYEMTFVEWNACAASEGCGDYQPGDKGWGRDRQPVFSVSGDNAWACSQTVALRSTLKKLCMSSLANLPRPPSGWWLCADGRRSQWTAHLRPVASPTGQSGGAEVFRTNTVSAHRGQRAPATPPAMSDDRRPSVLGAPCTEGQSERSALLSLIVRRAVRRLPTRRRPACLEAQFAIRRVRRHRWLFSQDRDETLENLS